MPLFRRARVLAWSSLLAPLVLACRDVPPTAPRDAAPRSAIEDGAHNDGNQHFYWLRPMVTPPATFPGRFDPAVAPEIRICALAADGATCSGGDIATFSSSTGAGSEVLRMEPGAEHYIVNWHTDRYDLDASKVYRIRAYLEGTLLGFADVEVGLTQKELRNVNTNEFIPLLDGRTLPIKFRVEEGAVPDEEARAIAASYFHSCGLANSGQAYCWGYGEYGQLGAGSAVNFSTTPIAVAGGHLFTQVVSGGYHNCALKADGTAWCWGYNGVGSTGKGVLTGIESVPVPVVGGHVFTSIASGLYHSCGLKADGTAWCWGYDYHGQLGRGLINVWTPTPVLAAGGRAFKAIGLGGFTSCGVPLDGSPALCWGYGYQGQRGDGMSGAAAQYQATPVAVNSSATFASLSVGTYSTCGLTDAGIAHCWGYNQVGTAGNGTISGIAAPASVVMPAGRTFSLVDVGEYHACALTADDGSAYCWGNNGTGQLGIGSTATPRTIPTAVAGTDRWVGISAGLSHTCGITTLGVGKCWGYDGYGQLGDGAPTGGAFAPTPIAGGITFATP